MGQSPKGGRIDTARRICALYGARCPLQSSKNAHWPKIGGVSLYVVESFEEGTPDEGYAPFLLTDLLSQCPEEPGWWQSNVPEERHRAYPVILENDSLQSVDRCLDTVLRQYMLNRAAFEMLGELQRGTILHGAALVDDWRRRLKPYPNSAQGQRRKRCRGATLAASTLRARTSRAARPR